MSKPKINKTIQIPDQILRNLLTPSEIRMLKNRWQIIQYLEDGLSIRKIAEHVKVGTDTVVRVSKMLQENNLHSLMGRQRQKEEIKSQTPWIFGKND